MMMLGENKISKMFLGDRKIKAAYLGEKQVYQSNKPSRLPDGYTEVEYIQSGSGQYIATGVTTPTIVDMDVEPLTTASGGYFWGANGSTATRKYACYKGSSSTVLQLPAVSSTLHSVSGNTSNKRIRIVYNRLEKKFSVDGEEVETNWGGTFYTSGAIYLLFGNNMSISGATYTALNAKLYSCVIYNNSSELARDFVPCINPSGVPGAYDLVSGTFFASGSGTFTPGPAV